MNRECVNYKLALEDNIEACPACGKPTEQVGRTVKTKFILPSMISGVVAVFIYWFFGFSFGGFSAVGMGLAFGISIASIVVAFISKSIASILVTIGLLAFMIGYIAVWAI